MASKSSSGSSTVLRQWPKTSRLMAPTIVVHASSVSTTFSTGMPGRSPSVTGATAARSSSDAGLVVVVHAQPPAAWAATSGRTRAVAIRV